MAAAYSALKERVSVPEALALLGVTPNEHHKIPCPFHEDDTPSLHIYQTRWYSYCCGRWGDVFDLVQALVPEVETVGQAYQFLDGQFDLSSRPVIETPKREVRDFTSEFMAHALPRLDHAHMLMKSKGWHRLFSTQDLLGWGVRANTTHLLIPHYHEGRVVGVKTRKLTTGEKLAWNGSTFTTQPYMPEVKIDAEVVVIAEGESDSWALMSYYRDDPVQIISLPSGASSWREEWVEYIDTGEVWLMLDNDRAGDEAEKKIRKSLPRAQRVALPENDVVETLLEGWRLPRP